MRYAMFQELLPNEQLDFILGIMRKSPNSKMEFEDIIKGVSIRFPATFSTGNLQTEEYLMEILDHLNSRKHIRIINEKGYNNAFETGIVDTLGHVTTCYQITFAGRVFEGYTSEVIIRQDKNTRLENLENHQKHHQSYMTWLTVILAVFASLSVFLQSLEKFHVVFRIHIWTAFFLFASGILVGIAIFLIILEVLHRKIDK